MTSVNSNFLKLQSNYLFAEIARKVARGRHKRPAFCGPPGRG